MTNDQEPRVLSPAEIEALRQEMRRSIKWAQAELARLRATKPLIGVGSGWWRNDTLNARLDDEGAAVMHARSRIEKLTSAF